MSAIVVPPLNFTFSHYNGKALLRQEKSDTTGNILAAVQVRKHFTARLFCPYSPTVRIKTCFLKAQEQNAVRRHLQGSTRSLVNEEGGNTVPLEKSTASLQGPKEEKSTGFLR